VGGGFTGLPTALHCAERSLSAHVLEAKQIVHGESGIKERLNSELLISLTINKSLQVTKHV